MNEIDRCSHHSPNALRRTSSEGCHTDHPVVFQSQCAFRAYCMADSVSGPPLLPLEAPITLTRDPGAAGPRRKAPAVRSQNPCGPVGGAVDPRVLPGFAPGGVSSTVSGTGVREAADKSEAVVAHTPASTLVVTKSVSQDVVESFVLFCEKYGVDASDFQPAMKLCVLLGLVRIDIEKLCEAVLPHLHKGWTNLPKGTLVFGSNIVTWVDAMQFFCLDERFLKEDTALAAGHPIPKVLTSFALILKQSGIVMGFDHVCRLFILCSVGKLPMMGVVSSYRGTPAVDETTPEGLAGAKVAREFVSTAQAQNVVSGYVDNRVQFESDACYQGMVWIFTHFHVRSNFAEHLRWHAHHRSSVQARLRIKNTRVNTGRERLRDRLLAIVPDKSVHRLNDDSFEAWCGRCRFPRNVSLWLREKLYLLRAQSFDVPEVVREMVSGDVADLVIANAVNFPEVSRIDKIISKLLWNGQPFPLLEKFHAQALSAGGMPISHVRAMQTPQIAKLYVVAYQRKDWRSHWVAARQSINHTLVTHVERFVSMHPICIPSFVKMLRVS
jgi:hypothetical protein